MKKEAISRKALKFKDIHWKSAAAEVYNFQSKIAVAFLNGKMEEVKLHQKELVRSFAARAFPVRQVTENKGKNTPGVDGII